MGRRPKPEQRARDMTVKAAEAFAEYCALGTGRTYLRVADILKQQHQYTGTPQTIASRVAQWSSKYGWVERVKDYDLAAVEDRRRKRDAEIERMNEEHAMFGRTQALRAIATIQKMIEEGRLGSQAAVQLFKYATDLERVARGEASTNDQTKVNNEVKIIIEQDNAV
jgi:hypothetical protein